MVGERATKRLADAAWNRLKGFGVLPALLGGTGLDTSGQPSLDGSLPVPHLAADLQTRRRASTSLGAPWSASNRADALGRPVTSTTRPCTFTPPHRRVSNGSVMTSWPAPTCPDGHCPRARRRSPGLDPTHESGCGGRSLAWPRRRRAECGSAGRAGQSQLRAWRSCRGPR